MNWSDFLAALPLACAAAFLIALGVCIAIVVSYKRKVKSPTYPLTDFTSLELTSRSDLYIGKTVTRVRIQSNNNRK